MPERRRWPLARRVAGLGVRGRSVLVAVGVVLAALLIGGTGFVFALKSSLERAGEAAASARAAEIVARIGTDGPLPTATTLAEEASSDAVALVLDQDGRVLGSSRRATTTPLSPQRPAVGQYQSVRLDIDTLDVGGEWQVVTTAAASSGATYYVQVAQSILIQRDVLQTVTLLMLAGTPLLLAAAGVAAWFLVGRALRAVETVRAAVAAVDPQDLGVRVEVPPSRDELAALATTMNSMLDRLEGADRAQRAFVSDASHELGSPVSTLTTAAELATRTGDEETRTRLLQTMDAELGRLRAVVADLRALARLDRARSHTDVTDVDLDDLVEAEVARLRITGHNLVEVRVEAVRIRGDLPRVAQSLRNLVDNADRHARRQVVLTLTRNQANAVIWVDNDGPEIAYEDRTRIFERFVRLDDSRSRDLGGSGLGLAIVRASIEAQGGEVAVVEHPRGWCRFEIRLPLPTP